MIITTLRKIVLFFTLGFFVISAVTHALAASPALVKAKEDAEAKGYIFFTSHDEIVAIAKKEGRLKVSSGLEPPNFNPLIAAFKQKYPFITEIYIEGIPGIDAQRKFILEMKSGQTKGWDITHIPIDLANEYMPFLMKHDILGMAKQSVLKIDPRMVHPGERNILSYTTTLHIVAYNRKLISEDKLPAKWEDFLKPEFKGKKFVLDLRPNAVASLVPAWGLERTLDFARKLAAQEPVWGRAPTRITTAIAAGEYSLSLAPNFNATKKVMSKDPTGNLSYKLIEPVPTRVVDHTSAILKTADHPHAALLWMEFLASPEGQEIIDKYEPLRASAFSPGSAVAQLIRGKELSVVDWDHFTKLQEYEAKILAAYGFPAADR